MSTTTATANAPELRQAALALNASQGGDAVAALCFELPTDAAQGVMPRTITLIPAPGADGLIRGVDGRAWRLSRHDQLIAAFNRPRAITENHAGHLAAPQGGSSPAFGWINAVRREADGRIVGDVEWTPRGVTALQARDYRYVSPEFHFDPKSAEILALLGASLVNDPNFPQLALNRGHDPEPSLMNLTAIARALGIADTADEAACITAINSLRQERQTALNAAQHPDPTRFAPRDELTVALNRATTAEAELQKLKDGQREADITAALDEAQGAGKIVPATRDYYLAMCRAEGGLEKFREYVKVAPVIAEPTRHGDKKPGAETGAEGLTQTQLAICRDMGMDPKAYAASLKSLQQQTA